MTTACCVLPVTAESLDKPVGVLLSREISPYVTMVEGLEKSLGNIETQRFFLDEEGAPYSLGGTGNAPDQEQYSAIVAVGPEALLYLAPESTPTPLLYGMILNPWSLFSDLETFPCGVSLNLPITEQLVAIRDYLPGVKQLGVLYDPQNNQQWFDQALLLASDEDIELIPIQVRRTASQMELVGDLNQPDAFLFIPDKSIISKAVVQYVIREAYQRNKPVVGYNRFFHNSGAALSFVVDYESIGVQVGELVVDLHNGGSCQETIPPDFSILVNRDAWRVLRLPDPPEELFLEEEVE